MSIAKKITRALRCCAYFLQHVSHANQMVVENDLRYIKELEDRAIGNRVIHVAAGLPANHYVAHAQNRKLLRDVCLFNLESFAELIHAFLPITKAIEDPNANRVCESLEELSFKVRELLWH